MAGNRVINTVLSLKDKFSNVIKNVANNTSKWQNEIEKSSKALESMEKVADVAFKGIGVAVAGVSAAIGVGTASFVEYDEAVRQLQASTGSLGENLDDVMKKVYGDNFGESWGDVANSISVVNKLIGGTKEEITEATENAISFRNAFGYEVHESTRAASTLMKQFGIDSKQAYNLMAQGEQQGLDYSGELIDSINEYSVQFAKFGFTAEDMFNIFNDGAKDGAFNLDKVGDAVKEFSIRAIDGSNTTIDGFTQLGMKADDMASKFGAGGETARNAFIEVVDAIKNVNDPVQQSIIGVDLFGTMWEDLGPEVVTQLSNIGDEFNKDIDTMKQINDIKYTSFMSGLTGIKRQIEASLIPLGESLVPIMNDFANWFADVGASKIESFANIISSVLPGAIEVVKNIFAGLQPLLDTAISSLPIVISLIAGFGGAFATLKIVSIIGNIISVGTKVFAVISKISFAFQAVAGGAATLGEGMALLMGPVGWIALAIGSIIAIGTLLYAKCEGFRNLVNSAIAGIVSWFQTSLLPAIQSVWDKIMNFWNSVLLPLIEWIGSALTPVFETVFPIITQYVSDTFNAIGSVIEGALQVFGGLIDFITGVFTGDWSLAWQGVVNIFGGIFDGLGSLLKVPLNVVIGLINSAISSINSNLQFDVPDWVPSIGGQHIGANISKIPTLYKGTDYFKGGSAIVGEHGPELVTMPSGAKVNTNSETKKLLNNNNIPPIQVIIQGNVIGNEQFADYVGNHIVNKVKLALNNM